MNFFAAKFPSLKFTNWEHSEKYAFQSMLGQHCLYIWCIQSNETDDGYHDNNDNTNSIIQTLTATIASMSIHFLIFIYKQNDEREKGQKIRKNHQIAVRHTDCYSSHTQKTRILSDCFRNTPSHTTKKGCTQCCTKHKILNLIPNVLVYAASDALHVQMTKKRNIAECQIKNHCDFIEFYSFRWD